MSLGPALVIAVFLLLGNAFFVGAEFALISARRTQIEPRAAAGSRLARTTLRAMERVSLMMAGAQLGITMCSIGLGAVAEPAIAAAFEGPLLALGMPAGANHIVAIALALLIVVSLHMVLGEMVPKNLALAGPERSALILGPLLFGIVTVLRPIIWVLNAAANVILRMLRVPVREEVATTFTRDEVAGLVEESARHGLLDAGERDLLTGALDFADVPVSEIAIPVLRVVSVPPEVTPRELQQWCVRTGFSRFPVVQPDGVIAGYVHVKDLVAIPESKIDLPLQPRWIRDLPAVHPADSLGEVLATMQRRGVHMVQVLASGELQGVAMMEDVLEELVGEVVA
jgi:CBS domain containing-hemolysin-like protein